MLYWPNHCQSFFFSCGMLSFRFGELPAGICKHTFGSFLHLRQHCANRCHCLMHQCKVRMGHQTVGMPIWEPSWTFASAPWRLSGNPLSRHTEQIFVWGDAEEMLFLQILVQSASNMMQIQWTASAPECSWGWIFIHCCYLARISGNSFFRDNMAQVRYFLSE